MPDRHEQRDEMPRTLKPEDAEVLDAILEARSYGADVGPLPPGSAKRAEKLRGVLQLLEKMPVESVPSDITDRTLESIRNARQRARFAEQIDMLKFGSASSGGFNINMRQAASAAAILIIGISLLLPTLSRGKHESQRIACASNMALMGRGLSEYATAHNGYLPRTTHDPMDLDHMALLENGLYPRVAYPKARPNSANLFLLLKNSFVDAEHAFCPGLGKPDELINDDGTDFASAEAVPFSYQNQVTAPSLQMQELKADHALLADRNPLFVIRNGRFLFDENRSPNSCSDAHAIPGQNVLTAGLSVRWTVRPVVHPDKNIDDNIWIAQAVKLLEAEEHAAEHDAFLTP